MNPKRSLRSLIWKIANDKLHLPAQLKAQSPPRRKNAQKSPRVPRSRRPATPARRPTYTNKYMESLENNVASTSLAGSFSRRRDAELDLDHPSQRQAGPSGGDGTGGEDDDIQWGGKLVREEDIASSRSQSPEPPERASGTALHEHDAQDLTHAPADGTAETLTSSQLHHAKVLILDLLGWGVTPEYLLQRGVSHALLCCVFAELHLRVPEGIAADYAAILAASGRRWSREWGGVVM